MNTTSRKRQSLLSRIKNTFLEYISNDEKKCEAFLKKIPTIEEELYADLDFFYESDPACESRLEIVYAYPGYKAIVYYRISHALYELEMNMAREYFSYSLDSTQHYLKSCQAIARDQLKDKDRYNAATIMLGHLYGKGGNYLEASQILYGQIDSASLSPSLKAEYYWVLYDFCGDIAGNSGIVESLSIPPASAYLPTLFRLLPKDSPRWRMALRNKYIEEGNLQSADSVSALLLAGVKPEDRDYAIHAYFQSEIEYRRGNPAERMRWLVQSAECDLVNAVRDYASLTMVAQIILPSDVDRSFRYLRMAQEDALAYNARLRPWQISRFLMEVEDAYSVRQADARSSAIVGLVVMAVLVVILLLATWMLVARSRNLTRTKAALESSNRKLAQADKVKGLLKVCRQNTDTAISNVFDVINAVNTLTPNAELTKNIDFLIALEDRVRQYNLGKKKSGASDDEDGIIESITGGSDTTTVTPENNSGGSGTGSISQNGTSGQSDGNSGNQNPSSGGFGGDMN